MSVSHLIKEPGFFVRYKLKPEDAYAIYADDDAMAEFIIHGDIVIFDRAKTSPRSGKIFAFKDGGGSKIRQLWIQGNGNWLLESRNPNKQLYPDLEVAAADVGAFTIQGEFVYRQGG